MLQALLRRKPYILASIIHSVYGCMLVQPHRRAHVFQHAHSLHPRGTKATLAVKRMSAGLCTLAEFCLAFSRGWGVCVWGGEISLCLLLSLFSLGCMRAAIVFPNYASEKRWPEHLRFGFPPSAMTCSCNVLPAAAIPIVPWRQNFYCQFLECLTQCQNTLIS